VSRHFCFIRNGRYDEELHRLLFNYLRISPSYGLICANGARRVTRITPEASRKVIKTFKQYGDVFGLNFDAWAGPALAASGYTTLPAQGLIRHVKPQTVDQGEYLTLHVPKNLPIRTQLIECERLLRLNAAPLQPKLEAVIRHKTLWKALATVYERAKHPDIELWRVGLLANCVERFNGKLDAWAAKKQAQHSEMRRHLTLIVVRFLVLALLVAENAAMGAFPVKLPLDSAQIEFPFAELELHNRLMASGDAEYREICSRIAPPEIKSALLPPAPSRH
jgi:hypothetical protein